MNRILTLLLACALLLSSMGCSRQPQNDPENDLPTDLQQPVKDSVVSDKIDTDIKTDITTDPESPAAPPVEEPYVRVIDPAKPMVALTFDDGPHPVYSHAILDILEQHHGVATFFEVAVNIPRAPDALVRMLELGCEVGSHSNSHQDLGKLNQKDMLQDLDTADKAFIAATGQAPYLLRPPYGSINDAVKLGSGRSVITWDVDTMDWKLRDTAAIVSYVQSLGNLDGRILLLHSIYESTSEATKILVPWLMEQGYQLVTISELFAYYYGELLQPNQLYSYTYFNSHSRTDSPAELPDPSVPRPPVEIPVIEVELKPVKPVNPTPVAPQPVTPVAPPVEPQPQEPAPAPTPPVTEEPIPTPTPPAEEPTAPDTPVPPVDEPPAETPPTEPAPADPPVENVPAPQPPAAESDDTTPPAGTVTETPPPTT